MPADISALFTLSVDVEAMLGVLLLYIWVQHINIKAMAWWGAGHLLRAGSILLFATYGQLPNWITIDLTNAMLLTSFAVTWTGARLYGGRRTNVLFILGGAIVWLVACQIPQVAQSVAAKALLSSAIVAGYTWLTAAEFWRNNKGQLVSRLPAFCLLFAQGSLFLAHMSHGVLTAHAPSNEALFGSIWLTAWSSDVLLFTIAIAFILMAMAKEHTAQLLKTSALLDPLTGIWNRRAFMAENDRVMQASEQEIGKVAVLSIGLDNLKTINDRYSRLLGDRLLLILAAMAKTSTRPSDFVGRLDGDEIVVVLFGASYNRALAVAERVRSAFVAKAAAAGGQDIGATVSIGVKVHEGPMIALTELLWIANRALSRAKAHGRNRVEIVWADGVSVGEEANVASGAIADGFEIIQATAN
jgi:diguanylate cyclase (GGDEF)-like protein